MVSELYVTYIIDSNELTVSKINTKIRSNHSRSIINFYKAIINPGFDDLDIDI